MSNVSETRRISQYNATKNLIFPEDPVHINKLVRILSSLILGPSHLTN